MYEQPYHEEKHSSLDSGRYARVREFQRRYEQWLNALQPSRSRMQKNWNMYSGVDYKQWDSEALEVMFSERRPVTTFNIIQQMVDNIIGQVEANPYEANFENLEEEDNKKVNLTQELWDRDFEVNNYRREFRKMLRAGLVYQGWLQIYPDFRRSDYPTIGVREVNPGNMIYDPTWKTDDINDCEALFRYTWMKPEEVMRNTGKKNIEELKFAIERKSRVNYDMPLHQIADRNPEYYDANGDLYKVVECVWMEEVETTRMFDNTKQEFKEETDMSPETMMGLSKVNGNRYKIFKGKKSVCKIFRFCPAIGKDVILEDGDYPIQIGRYPYFTWSAKNLYGELQGIVDPMVDAQETLNKREAMATHWQMIMANGAEFIEEDMFVDDDEFQRYKREKNTPGSTFKVAAGSNASQKHKPIERGVFPQDLLNSADRAKGFLQEMSSDVFATQERTRRSGETASLFNEKANYEFIRLDSINEGLNVILNDIAEAWWYAMKKMYRKTPMVVKNKDKQLIHVNNHISEEIVENAVADIPRQAIVIARSKNGLARKREFLQKYNTLAQMSTNPLMKSWYEKLSIKYQDLDKEEELALEDAANTFIEFQKTQMAAQTATLNAQMGQLGGGGELPPGADQAAKQPGQQDLPGGIAGGQGAENNIGGANSDQIKR